MANPIATFNLSLDCYPSRVITTTIKCNDAQKVKAKEKKGDEKRRGLLKHQPVSECTHAVAGFERDSAGRELPIGLGVVVAIDLVSTTTFGIAHATEQA